MMTAPEVRPDRRLRLFESLPVSLTARKASGNRIWTDEYGELVDMESGCWAAPLGHAHPEILETLIEQAPRALHLHEKFVLRHASDLTEELCDASGLSGGDYCGTYLTSGTEAVSAAVWLAENLTKRTRKLCTNLSYLGATPDLRMPRNPDAWTDLDIRGCLDCGASSRCDLCEKLDGIDFRDHACFVFEPGNSGGRVLCPPPKLVSHLSARIRETGGLVVCNEVTTGFGRTGRWFGFQHYPSLVGASDLPDLIALGKGLGNGYPVSGVLLRSSLARQAREENLIYVQSHIDDPLGCAVARKVVEILGRDGLVARGDRVGASLRAQVEEARGGLRGISEVRGRGMMNVFQVPPEASPSRLFTALLRRGYFLGLSKRFQLLRAYAPLTLTDEEVRGFSSALRQALEEEGEEGRSPETPSPRG
ncbi:aminotransferase class-III [Aminomonas paucivorans DSM 12260]|uniref:Aminotransferase class-III n=1 Tax=Aminomonas paucivorans DSM 12260 TaxID=584708 RepID=E3CY86_9BACT|nr:aminotransferase class III-fold pyridoxal phosphate-dependent enzyme [Aminomonas paucivorans]EFQ23619.1 aminotransferase class-III [Aminomonas paucivorans DSM 12260]